MNAIAHELLTSAAAAQELGVTPARIRQICLWSEGKIGRKMGRDWFLTYPELQLIRMKFRKYEKSK